MFKSVALFSAAALGFMILLGNFGADHFAAIDMLENIGGAANSAKFISAR